MGVYALKMKNTSVQCITMQLILDLYKEYVWGPGDWVARKWWE